MVGPVGVRYCSMPLRRILVFITAQPAISMAPQKLTSPSPWAGDARVWVRGEGAHVKQEREPHPPWDEGAGGHG